MAKDDRISEACSQKLVASSQRLQHRNTYTIINKSISFSNMKNMFKLLELIQITPI